MKEGGEDRAAYRRAPGEGDKERGIALFLETLSFLFRKPCPFFLETLSFSSETLSFFSTASGLGFFSSFRLYFGLSLTNCPVRSAISDFL
jgi:hypothetical protein